MRPPPKMTPPIGLDHGHDHRRCVSDGLAAAERYCTDAGLRLTPVRRRVLALLLAEHRARGAYELLDALRCEGLGSQPPVVYRALAFLMKHGLAHKIERKHRVFLATYTVALLLLPACYFTLGLAGDGDPDTAPPIHPVVTHCVDLYWICHMLLEQSFTPPERPLLMTLRVEEAEKSKKAVAPAGVDEP